MNILDQIEQTRRQLHAYKGRYQEVCRVSGLDYSWLNKFSRGVYDNPSPVKVAALQEALAAMKAPDVAA